MMVSSKNLPAVQSTADIVKKYPADRFNLLLPSLTLVENIGPMQRVAAEEVKINPDPAKKEVYLLNGQEKKKADDQEVALASPALDRLGAACGISFHPDSGMIIDEPRRAGYKAIAMMKKPDGTWMVRPYERVIDLDVLERQARAATQKKIYQAKKHYQEKGWAWPGDDAWVESKVAAAMAQKESFLQALAETGAKNRAFRHYVGLKHAYTRAELAKPFVAIRIDFAPDVTDPETKRFLLEQGTSAAATMYPGGARGSSGFTPPKGQEGSGRPPGEEIEQAKEAFDYEGILDGPDLGGDDPEMPDEEATFRGMIDSLGFEDRRGELIAIFNRIHYNPHGDEKGIVKKWHEDQVEALMMAWRLEKELAQKKEGD